MRPARWAVAVGAAAHAVGVGAAAHAIAVLATQAAGHLPRRAREPWERINHAGRTVSLLEGPAWVVAAAGALLGGSTPGGHLGRSRVAQASLLVSVAAGALGALDDLAGSASSKGLKGHLTALRRGEVTTGALKIAGLGITGLVGAAMLDGGRAAMLDGGRAALAGGRGAFADDGGAFGDGRGGELAVTVVGAAVVAGAANAINLFDLRPGRALKVVLATAAPLALAGSLPAGAALGASSGVIAQDLAGRSMLGDTGANAAGALLGVAVLERTGLRGRLAALAVLTALTLASERVSFTKVIEDNAVLRRMDEWGRFPS